jgi:hypothetical protein
MNVWHQQPDDPWWKVFQFRLLVVMVGVLLLMLLAQSLELLHNLGVLP